MKKQKLHVTLRELGLADFIKRTLGGTTEAAITLARKLIKIMDE